MLFGMYIRSCRPARRAHASFLRPRHPWRRLRTWVELDRAWAEQTFGHAKLRDARRVHRLVSIATCAALKPAALLTVMFADDPNGLETAYDFYENSAIEAAEIARAHHVATARRCRGHALVFLAVDGSSFAYPDAVGAGPIGTRKAGAKGLKTMVGLAVGEDGVPIGLLGERVWTRPKQPKKPHATRPVADKETRYWHDVIDEAHDALGEHAPDATLWPQLDREGDSWSVLVEALRNAETRYTTVRARGNRTLVRDRDGADETEPGGHVLDALARARVEATYDLAVPAGPARAERTARMTLRWVEVTLDVRGRPSGTRHPVPVFALLAEEDASTTPKGEKPVRWLLLTTYPIESVRDACLVLYGYSLRWRVEMLFAALKDRGCRLEDSELETAEALQRFVAVMFAVGARLLRLVYLGRHQPERPAREALTAHEIMALGLSLGHDVDDEAVASLTIGDAVVLLGKLGGHVGNPDKRPIGFKVLGRGLAELRPMVRLVARGHLQLGKLRPRSSQR